MTVTSWVCVYARKMIQIPEDIRDPHLKASGSRADWRAEQRVHYVGRFCDRLQLKQP